jgi:hypothetical protein
MEIRRVNITEAAQKGAAESLTRRCDVCGAPGARSCHAPCCCGEGAACDAHFEIACAIREAICGLCDPGCYADDAIAEAIERLAREAEAWRLVRSSG